MVDARPLKRSALLLYPALSAAVHPSPAPLAVALGRDHKGQISLVLYTVGIVISFVSGPVAFVVYTLVALIWFIPDRRIERNLPR